MEKAIIIEKLKMLMSSWAKSADSKIRTADSMYPPDNDGLIPWENKSLHFAANTQGNCCLALNAFVTELEES